MADIHAEEQHEERHDDDAASQTGERAEKSRRHGSGGEGEREGEGIHGRVVCDVRLDGWTDKTNRPRKTV